MNQQIKINKDDLQDLIIYAERYSLGRMTFAPHTIKQIILNHLSDIKTGTIKVIISDIERERDREHLGMECDKVTWLDLLDVLKSEIKKREKPTTRMATLTIPHDNC